MTFAMVIRAKKNQRDEFIICRMVHNSCMCSTGYTRNRHIISYYSFYIYCNLYQKLRKSFNITNITVGMYHAISSCNKCYCCMSSELYFGSVFLCCCVKQIINYLLLSKKWFFILMLATWLRRWTTCWVKTVKVFSSSITFPENVYAMSPTFCTVKKYITK